MALKFGEKYDEIIEIDNKELIIPPLGFLNTGGVCYFNALLQCLLSSKNFLRFLLFDKPHNLLKQFCTFIVDNKWDSVFSTRLLQSFNMVEANQSCSEYFTFLVDILGLEPIFEYHYKDIYKCKTCGNSKESKDKSINTVISENFIEFFHFFEEIENYNCDYCKNKTIVEKKKIIQALPPIVAISFNKYFGKKLIEYPPNFKIGNVEYILIGCVEHSGHLGGGHYICRVLRNGKYYIINDDKVNSIEDLIPISETYMVFYERIK
jgi:ubiquitin C-terminal hydrolase